MRLITIALAVCSMLAFWIGRRSRNAPDSPPPPAADSATPLPPAAAPTAVRLPAPPRTPDAGPVRRWLEANRTVTDPLFGPMIGLLVAIFAALATGIFAYQTNSINRSQQALLRQQVELQAMQSLPAFSFSREFTFDAAGAPVTDLLHILNRGGLARNVDIRPFPMATIVITTGDGETHFLEVPLVNYDDAWLFIEGNLTDEPVTLGREENFAAASRLLAETEARIAGDTERRWSVDTAYVVWIVEIAYQDFQGNDRTEMYRYWEYPWDDTGLNPVEALSGISAAEIGEHYRRFEEAGLVLDTFDGGTEQISPFLQRLYAEIDRTAGDSAAPAASPAAAP